MNADDVVGRWPATETGDLLEAAWTACSEEQQSEFVQRHRDQLEELVQDCTE